MHFDLPTLFSLLALQSLVLALALPVLMGWHQLSPGGRHAQAAMTLHGVGWLLLVLAPEQGNRWVGALAMAAIAAALSALWFAIAQWLGPRRGRRLMLALPALAALLYLLSFGSFSLRTSSSNALFCAQLLLLCLALIQAPKSMEPELVRASWRWRGLLLGCLAVMALLTGGRAALAALHESAYPSFATPHPLNTLSMVLSVLAVPLTMAAMLAAWRGEAENAFQRLAQTDVLTGLCNRRAFLSRSVDHLSMARRYKEPLALMMLDIDFLKALNDKHGPEMGDRALALFGRCLQEQKRLGDLVGRVGGEEFAVLMMRCDAQGPEALDKRLREALALKAPAELGFALDFSAGWARLRHGDRDVEDLMRRAETALYEAKRTGRGRLLAEPGLEG